MTQGSIYPMAQWPGTSTWWRHQMETFSASLAICAGNSPVPVNSPHKGQWCGALMFSLICVWINGWVNNREAGNLRRYHAHYDITIMKTTSQASGFLQSCLVNHTLSTLRKAKLLEVKHINLFDISSLMKREKVHWWFNQPDSWAPGNPIWLNLVSIGSGNGLAPNWCQTMISINADPLLSEL